VTFNLSPSLFYSTYTIVFGCSTIIELDVNVHSSYLFLIGEIYTYKLCVQNVRSYVRT